MKTPLHILSTKKLADEEIHLLESADFVVMNHDFIKRTIQLPEKINPDSIHPAVVLTSSMAVKSWLAIAEREKMSISEYTVFCMEFATQKAIVRAGLSISGVAKDASSLADEILKSNARKVTFICSNIRRDELPKKLRASGVEVSEIVAYQTEPVSRRIAEEFQAVLFYSPSAIDSFLQLNEAGDLVAFCVGNTTATHAAKSGFRNVEVAALPSSAELVKSVIDYYINKPAHA